MTADTHPVEREQLMAYLDGELAANEAARVAAHLTACAECRQLEADLRSISAQMLTWNVEPAPPQISEAVLAALQDNPSQKPAQEKWSLFRSEYWNPVRIARWTLAAACLGIAAVILVNVFAPSPTGEMWRGSQAAKINNAPADQNSSLSSGPPSSGSGVGPRDESKAEKPRPMPESLAATPPAAMPAPPSQSAASQPRSADSFGALEKRRADKISALDDTVIPNAPMIARTASLKIAAKNFQSARAGVDRIIATFHGFAASMTINNAVGEPQSLNAELHFPAAQCDAALAALKALGRVEQEQQGGEEVTAQVVDLDARLKNSRETETRLQDILKTRTGKVSDVLEVENQIAETRQSIEQMEGEQKALRNRITYSAITLDLHEEYQASLETTEPSAGRRIRNAVVDGFRAAAEGSLALLVFLLSAGPSLLLAAIILFWPIRYALRRLRAQRDVAVPAH